LQLGCCCTRAAKGRRRYRAASPSYEFHLDYDI
jgi:hypothetical protein